MLTYWMCCRCNYIIEAHKPPEPCPNCHEKCSFSNVTCYSPDLGSIGNLDLRLVALHMLKKEKPGIVPRFSDLIKGSSPEKKVKHSPVIRIGSFNGIENNVLVDISVDNLNPHTNVISHYIAWIQAFAVENNGHIVDLGREYFKPANDKSVYSFGLDISSLSYLFAFSYCNLHGIWEGSLKIDKHVTNDQLPLKSELK